MLRVGDWFRQSSGSRGTSTTKRRGRRCPSRPAVERLEELCLLSALPAFPGAEGFGALATGGRGGTVYHVTNLNDSGPGSFRDAVSRGGRIVVFDVGGNIELQSAVSVQSNITIAGQTAPGDGIAVEGREVSFSNSHNDIVRYIRFRQGAADPDSGKSTVNITNGSDMIFDHVSIEFGQWDNIDVNGSTNITVQDSIIADPIGQQFNAHVDSSNVTWANDIWSSAHNRNPLQKGDAQFVNNVVYNFQAGYTAGNTSGRFSHDIVNNYFISGPSTTNAGDAFYQMGSNQSVYAAGNYEDSNRDGRLNGGPVSPGGVTVLHSPWSPTTQSLPTLSASDAYAYDVANAGDSLHRDQVDTQVIGEVTSLGRTGHLWSSQTQTGLPNNGYGILAGGTAPADSDGDGMPDDWEIYYGLDPTQNNANGDFDGTGYTNIEKYINGLADGSYGYVPAPWQDGDIGGVDIAGTANYAGGIFTVKGAGSGIGGTSDQFNFVSQGLTGNGSIVAQVTSQTNTNSRAEAGVMFRNSSADDAAFADVAVTPDGHVFFDWRASDGGSGGYAYAYARAPVYVRLSRVGDVVSGSYSTDGTNWTQIGSRAIALSPDALVGLAVSANDNDALGTATFSDVSVTSGSQVDLSGNFNLAGIVTDGVPYDGGGLDGVGFALSANLLGSTIIAGGTTFTLGVADSNNGVQAAGQTIALPQGQYGTLSFLGVGVDGNQPDQTFTVNYSDGTSDTFTQDLSDWLIPQGYVGESTAITMAYRDFSDGTNQVVPTNLYQYSFSLDNQKTVSSITLPNNNGVVILALNLIS